MSDQSSSTRDASIDATSTDAKSTDPKSTDATSTPGMPEAITGELIDTVVEGAGETESVNQPARVMRIGAMIKQLLDEVRAAPLDEASRKRLKDIYDQSVDDLASALSSDLAAELRRLAPPITGSPSDAELRVAHAQLVGWLEGLFHGIQATLFAQQMAARQQLEQMRGELPPAPHGERPGTYL